MRQKLVILSGAGISAESGIATFRDANGLWENHAIEEVASPEGWGKNPKLVNTFYNLRRKNLLESQPNVAHKLIKDLESYFDVHIITQNVDDLHERAGSSNVLHLHGELLKMRCSVHHDEISPINSDITENTIASCGNPMRPHIVWFGEEVPVIELAIPILQDADILIIVGTSLQVYPAAGLFHYVPDNCLKYIVDTKIPSIVSSYGFRSFQAKASEGMAILFNELIN